MSSGAAQTKGTRSLLFKDPNVNLLEMLQLLCRKQIFSNSEKKKSCLSKIAAHVRFKCNTSFAQLSGCVLLPSAS